MPEKRKLLMKINDRVYVFAAWGVFLSLFHFIYHGFFPTARGTLGHDFGLALAGCTDGFIWFAKNGLFEVPWFTPSFCAGVPLFADPQSGYYSVPQWLSFIVDPLTAAYLTLLLFASLGYFGMYVLARRAFGLSLGWSIFAAALFFFNTFQPYRTILGEYGYHGLTLVPWLAWYLIRPTDGVVHKVGFALLAGLIAAYWLQSGLPTLMVPGALGVGLVLLAYRLVQPWQRDLLARMMLAVAVSVVFSASKLMASLAFYGRFERTQYQLPGFADPWALIKTTLLALFWTSEAAARQAFASMVNVQWSVLPHEWAYGFTIAPLICLLAAFFLRRRDGAQGLRLTGARWPALAIVVLALIPLVLMFYTPQFNTWLKQVPLIGATAWPMRWIVIYLAVLPLLFAMAAQYWTGNHWRFATASILILIGLQFVDLRLYYRDQPYNPGFLLAGYQRLAAGAVQAHRISFVGIKAATGNEGLYGSVDRNDVLVEGVSQAACYNPAFGYRLEKFPQGRLVLGDVMDEADGYLNIKNPACYVFPEENGCEPGDHFRVDQRAAAEAFVSYRPFPFAKSTKQRIADLVTMAGLAATATFLLLVWPWLTWRRRRAVDR